MERNESVGRAFTIIEYLAEQDDWMGLRKLARDLNLGSATASRFLTTLKELGYVKQHPVHGRYRLTLKWAWIGSRVMGQVPLHTIAHPSMQRLAADVNETIHLAMLENVEMAYIDKVDSQQAVQMRSRIGGRAPLHSTAVGRAVLAFMSDEQREALIGQIHFTSMTPYTIVDAASLRADLQLIGQRGYAVDDEENEIGIRCVGAPVFNHLGHPEAAISISGWTLTMTRERVPEVACELLATCNTVSAELGYAGATSIRREDSGSGGPTLPLAKGGVSLPS